MGILKKIADWLTGTSSTSTSASKKKKKEATTVSNYGGGVATTRKNYSPEVKKGIKVAKEKENARVEKLKTEVSNAFKANTPSSQRAGTDKPKPKTKSASSAYNVNNAFKAKPPAIKHQSTALGTVSEKEISSRTAKRNAFEANRKERSRAADTLKPLIDERYSTRRAGAPAYAKQGNYAADPDVAKYNVLKHPVATSTTRGGLSGATFGLSELAINLMPKSKEAEEAERLYQANKSKGAEFAGEMAGSLAGFGLTGGLSKAAVKKAAPRLTTKLGTQATERLATNNLIVNAARKEALRKLGAEATEDVVKRLARERAAKLVAAVGEDMAINLTTGAVSDISHAIIDSDNPAEFIKNMGINAGMNLGFGGLTTVAPALFRGSALDDSLRAMGDDAVDFGRGVARNMDNKSGGIKLSADGMPEPKVNVEAPLRPEEPRFQRVDEIMAEHDMLNGLPSLEELEARAKEPPKLERKKRRKKVLGMKLDPRENLARVEAEPRIEAEPRVNAEPKIAVEPKTEAKADVPISENVRMRDELVAERNALRQEYEAAKAKGEDVTQILDDMQELDLMIGDAERKIASAEPPRINTEPKAEVKTETPKAEQPSAKASEEVKEAINNEYVERQRNSKKISEKYHDYDEEIREVTGGELGERKGVVSVGKGANPKEQKRVLAKMGREADSIINSNGAVENADAFETVYRTWNAPRKASAMQKSYAKASEGVNDIADSIKAKVESFIKNPDNGTGMNIEDVFDMIAVKQVYKDSGIEMPADLQEAFTKLILANKTEHAQGLSVIEQVLREFDPDYRKAFIRKDFDKFLARFGNVESWDEVAASLDRNHKTDGYLQKKLQELVDFKVGESGTADEYKKLYKDLQNEILRNSKPNLWNMLDSLRHTFMLSNFATAARNIYGNASQRIMYDISDALTAQFEASLERRIARNPEVAKKYGEGFERTTTSLIKSKDNRAFASLGRIREGKLGAGLSKITDDAAKAADSEYIKMLEKNLKEDVQDVMGYEKLMPQLEKGIDYAPKNAREKLAIKAYRLSQKGGKVVSFMLNEPDSWFVERNYRTTLAKYLEANGITNMASLKGKEEVMKRAREHAMDVALENTYKKANRLTTFIERARAAGKKQGANPLQMVGSIALDAELPYVKVPVNMFINNVKYSPVGIATNSWKAIKAAHIGDVQGLQKSVAELSKGVTGTGLAALGFMLACDENEQMDNDSIGIIANANEALKKYGIRDNSVKVGEYNFNIADIGLGATQFLMGAAYAEALNENGGAPKGLLGDVNAVLDAFRSTFDVVGDLSLMDNFMQTVDAFSTSYGEDTKLSDRVENASMQILPNYVNQYIPNPLRAVAKGTTKADLDTGTRNGEDVSKLEKTLKRNVNNQIQGIPVVNEKGIKGTKFEGLPHKVDNHGNLISTGLYPEGRDTKKKKAVQSLVNYADPLSTRRIKIPEADKVELKVKDKHGKGYEPKAFDENREYKADIGKGKLKETIDLTGKEREKAATSMKKSGKDMAKNLVDRGWFGDSHGKRALEILSKVPEDEEKAREFFYNTTEFKRLSDEEKTKFFDDEYDKTKGRGRTANKAVYVDIKGNSEGDFRFTNDLTDGWKEKYDKFGVGKSGVDKGAYADILDKLAYAHHKYKDGKNVDTINTKGKTIATLLADENLTKEQRIAIYNAVRGNMIWKDWDGVSGASNGWRRWGHGWHRWHSWGSYQRKPSTKISSSFNAKGKPNVTSKSKANAPSSGVSIKSASSSTQKSTTSARGSGSSGGGNVTSSVSARGYAGTSKASPPSKIARSSSRVNTSKRMKTTALNVKTVKPPTSKGKKTSLSAALEDIQRTQKKVAPPKARKGK